MKKIQFWGASLLLIMLVFVSINYLPNFIKNPNYKLKNKDWQYYYNDKWDYSVEYPDDKFILCDTHKSRDVAAFFNIEDYSNCPLTLTEDTVSQFNIVIMDKYSDSTQGAELIEVRELLVGNKLGTIARYEVSPEVSIKDDTTYYLAELPLNDKKVSIIWLSSDIETFYRILDSLKFGDS